MPIAESGVRLINRRYQYCDDALWRKTCREQKARYRAQTATFAHREFTKEEDDMIMRHEISDRELSAKIGHSIGSIQTRRSRLRKKLA